MSGIAGILNADGAPVDRALLWAMTDVMAFRGPDAQETWAEGAIGLGHAMLRTTVEQAGETQPCSLDGQVWITADARIDGRAELKRKLAAKGRVEVDDATDVDLILHAYAAWGVGCVDHLLGDFVFAIWDGRERKLFCARDHFGVKPFYYADTGSCFVFSNTLNCVRRHPAISSDLNDLAIADFLLFGYNQEANTTSFAAIDRLPPAHTLTWRDGEVRVRRYWTLPIEETLRYRRPQEYVERFIELFRQAVDDRLRTERVGIFMSGGLDSTSVAAAARALLLQQQPAFDLRAYTIVYDRLIPDQERYWSGIAAAHLGIPIQYLAADEYELFERWDEPELRTAEPVDEPTRAVSVDHYRQAAANSRVVLSGYGGDPLLYPSKAHFVGHVRRLRFDRLVIEAGGYALAHGRLPPLYFRSWLRRRLGEQPWRPPYPEWLNPDLEQRLALRQRWDALWEEPPSPHPTRGEAYSLLSGNGWPAILTACDADATGIHAEVRHPFFDLRLVQYALRCPAVPWFVDKQLLRTAMQGSLPESIRLRPKAPLAGDVVEKRFARSGIGATLQDVAATELADYARFPELRGDGSAGGAGDVWTTLRAYGLALWLHGVHDHRQTYSTVNELNLTAMG